mgnify:FL=1
MQSVDLRKSTSHSTYDVLSVNQVLIQVVILHAISILMVLLLDIKSSYITEHICSVIYTCIYQREDTFGGSIISSDDWGIDNIT